MSGMRILVVLLLAILIPWWVWEYLLRLRVRLGCWIVSGRSIGVRGLISNMFRRACGFQWDCDCVWDLVKDAPGEPPGALVQAIRVCSAGGQYRKTLFSSNQQCTTVTIHTIRILPGVGRQGLALQLDGCRGRVVMSCEAAALFAMDLKQQWANCCL